MKAGGTVAVGMPMVTPSTVAGSLGDAVVPEPSVLAPPLVSVAVVSGPRDDAW